MAQANLTPEASGSSLAGNLERGSWSFLRSIVKGG